MGNLIVNADDFGYSSAVNAGIMASHRNGILTSATLMAGMPGTEEAIRLARETETLGVGCHLCLTVGRPRAATRAAHVDERGFFHGLAAYHELRATYDEDALFDEWSAQIEYLLERGVRLTHLDSHHHVHAFPENRALVERLSATYRLPFRNCVGVHEGAVPPPVTCSQRCTDIMAGEHLRSMERSYEKDGAPCRKELEHNLRVHMACATSELMVHPAFVDEHLYYHSSFNIQRMREVEVLTDPLVREMVAQMGFTLVNYGTAPMDEVAACEGRA